MFWTSERLMPHMALARGVSRVATTTLPSAIETATSSASVTSRRPLGPFTATVWPLTSAETPLGIAMGFLPMRDISQFSLEHLAENFAADVLRAGGRVRHDAFRRRYDRDAETVAHARQVLDRHVDASSRRRYALDLVNDRTALVILQFDLEFGPAVFFD